MISGLGTTAVATGVSAAALMLCVVFVTYVTTLGLHVSAEQQMVRLSLAGGQTDN